MFTILLSFYLEPLCPFGAVRGGKCDPLTRGCQPGFECARAINNGLIHLCCEGNASQLHGIVARRLQYAGQSFVCTCKCNLFTIKIAEMHIDSIFVITKKWLANLCIIILYNQNAKCVYA